MIIKEIDIDFEKRRKFYTLLVKEKFPQLDRRWKTFQPASRIFNIDFHASNRQKIEPEGWIHRVGR